MPSLMNNASSLLSPDFENAYWRSRRNRRYRDFQNFSKSRGHFEPEDHNSFASRWAEELAREESAAEIRQIYENAVVILGNKRSSMERADHTLDCKQLRFAIHSTQDPEDPARVLQTRSLSIAAPLNKLPEAFDDLFPFRPNELVVPFLGESSRKDVLEVLEHWESALRGKIEESADQNVMRLYLPSGLSVAVDLNTRETIFTKAQLEGGYAILPAISNELKALKLNKRLV